MPVDSLIGNVPAGAGNTVISAKSGVRIGKVTVIGPVGAGTVTIYDNATTNSGFILFVVPASAPIGSWYPVEVECQNGITAAGSTSSPSVNITFST